MKPITLLLNAAVVATALLSGCASPPVISSAPATPIEKIIQGSPTITTGLQNAAWNLDQAVAIGALKKDDPAPVCIHGILQQAGLEPIAGQTPAASFTPKVSDLISGGSVLYIVAQQAKAAKAQNFSQPVACDAVIGMFVRDAVTAGLTASASAVPGVSLVKALKSVH